MKQYQQLITRLLIFSFVMATLLGQKQPSRLAFALYQPAHAQSSVATTSTLPQSNAAVKATSAPTATLALAPVTPLPLAEAKPPVRLIIPSLNLAVEVTPMAWQVTEVAGERRSVWQVPLESAGWHVNSAGAGAAGNVVISGQHRLGAAVFAPLARGELQPGQQVLLVNELGQTFVYQVTSIADPIPALGATARDQEQAVTYLGPSPQAKLTLVTGWPEFSDSHLLFIVAQLVGILGPTAPVTLHPAATVTSTVQLSATVAASQPDTTSTITTTVSLTTTQTASATVQATPTATLTKTPTKTATATETHTPSATPSPTKTATKTPTATPSHTPTATATATLTPTATASPTPTPNSTATTAALIQHMVQATLTALAPTATDPQTPTATATATATPSATPSPTATQTPDLVATAVIIQPAVAATLTAEAPTATATSQATATPTWTPSPTATRTPDIVATVLVIQPAVEATLTARAPTATPTATATATATNTPTATATATATATPSPTMTFTPTPTATATATASPTATPTLTPFVVTATATPVDVFAAATRVIRMTLEAQTTGTATPTPPNLVLATATPTPLATATATSSPTATPTLTPFVVTATPTAVDVFAAATVVAQATLAAQTTGTATPTPINLAVVTAMPALSPTLTLPLTVTNGVTLTTVVTMPTLSTLTMPTVTVSCGCGAPPSTTPTPSSSVQPTPTRQPAAANPAQTNLRGKILFLADADKNGQPEAYAISPNGKQLTRLNGLDRYNRANGQEAFSLDQRFHAFSQKEMNGDQNQQIFYSDKLYNSVSQATFLGGITAWSPAWSPTHEAIAFVVTYAHNDEIWLAQRDVDNQWVTTPLTQNQWDRDRHPSWSPDGTQIVFVSTRGDGQRRLWIMDANGHNPQQVGALAFEAWDPVWVK